MADITAVITEDARKYWPQLLTGGLGTPISLDSTFTVTDVLSNLSAGDLFWYNSVLYMRVAVDNGTFAVPGTAQDPAGANDLYVMRMTDGTVSGMGDGTAVTRQHGYSAMPIITSFKIGEGGWIDQGSGPVPRIPDSTLRRLDNNLQDIDAIVDTTRATSDARYAPTSRNYFEKYLDYSTDISFVTPTSGKVRCLLLTSEFNDDGYGADPELWEIGLFSEHPEIAGERLMVAYGTFPKQTKTVAVQIENYVNIIF